MSSGGDDTGSVVEEVVAEAARLRASGALPSGYEEDLDRRFLEIAADPAALAVEAAAGGSVRRPKALPGTGIGSLLPRVARKSKRTAGRVLHLTRTAAGPRIRSAERSSIERAGRLTESVVVRSYVAADHARRVASDHTSGRFGSRLSRMSPASRTLPAARSRRARDSTGASLGGTGRDPASGSAHGVLGEWAIERLTRLDGPIAHVECGDGELLRRLAEAGFDAMGADPGSAGTPDGVSRRVVRAGALEFLGGCPKASLGGLLLSGVTERLTPGRARALARLGTTRLRPGGVVIVLSAHPDYSDGDLVSSDLADGRPLHPVTWCHLFSRHGLIELTVNDPVSQPTHRYAVAARMPQAEP